MMQSKSTSIFKAGKIGIIMTVVAIGFVSALMMTSQLQEPIIQSTIHQKKGIWEPLGDITVASGASGVLAFFIYPHAANPAVTYSTNCSNATAYEYLDAITGEMTRTTSYNTAFDFVVKYRLNGSDGYNNSAAAWTLLWSYVSMNCNFNWTADFAIIMTDVQVAVNANYEWIQCYANNAGAGYQLSKNEKASWNTSGWVLR